MSSLAYTNLEVFDLIEEIQKALTGTKDQRDDHLSEIIKKNPWTKKYLRPSDSKVARELKELSEKPGFRISYKPNSKGKTRSGINNSLVFETIPKTSFQINFVFTFYNGLYWPSTK